MTPNQLLVAFVFLFWGLVWLAIKISHLVNGRPLSDGPSLVPLLLIVPIPSIALGVGLNRLYSQLGTVSVVVLYLGVVVFAFGTMWLHDYRSTDRTDASDGG